MKRGVVHYLSQAQEANAFILQLLARITDVIVNPHARYLAGEFCETLLLRFSPKLGEIKGKQRRP